MRRAKLVNWDSAGLEPEVQWDRDGFGMDLFFLIEVVWDFSGKEGDVIIIIS